jgi:predicted trehalose synthase
VVFIFAKTPSDSLASLVKEIDGVVAKNAPQRLAAVVNFTGEPNDEYLAKTKEFAKKHELKNVAVTVTQDGDRFGVADEAEVTVMHYKDKKVKFNLAVDKDGLTKDTVQSIVKGTSSILE